MAKELTFPVSELLLKPQGTKEEFTLNAKPDLGADFKLKSSIKAKVVLMAMHDEIHVELRELEADIEQECNRCLKKYPQKIKIPLIQSEFLLKRPGTKEDYFLIDKKNATIDLSELLRQEIVLHFPLIPVCSKSCKGLCPKCGIDLNTGKCECTLEKRKDKPLAILRQFSSPDKDATQH